MEVEEKFEYMFNSNIEESKTIENDDIKCPYIQYLLDEYNKSQRVKNHFDSGIISSNNKSFFLWGSDPLLIKLLGSSINVNDLFDHLKEEYGLEKAITGMEFGAKKYDQEIIKEVRMLKDEICKKQELKEDKFRQKIIYLIQKSPYILGYDGKIKMKSEKISENPEVEFRQALFDCLCNFFDSYNPTDLINAVNDITPFCQIDGDDLENSDLVFLVNTEDGNYKIISIELKFGKNIHNHIGQFSRTHIFLSKFFKNTEVNSILFSPYYNKIDIKEKMLKKFKCPDNRKNNFPNLLLDGLEFKENINSCFGNFKKEDEFCEQLKDQDRTEKNIENHLSKLKEILKEVCENS